nr:MAG TPA: hypothetical protein [Caudoviricetes sp.]
MYRTFNLIRTKAMCKLFTLLFYCQLSERR